jgi:hypothetical protein
MKWLVLVTILTFVGLAMVVYDGPSKSYWQDVGPSWDRMLNPNKYKEQQDEGN